MLEWYISFVYCPRKKQIVDWPFRFLQPPDEEDYDISAKLHYGEAPRPIRFVHETLVRWKSQTKVSDIKSNHCEAHKINKKQKKHTSTKSLQ